MTGTGPRRVARSSTALVVWCVVAMLLGACTSSSAGARDGGLQVVVTFSILADIVGEIAGDGVEVTSLVPLGGDPHAYEPTPSDAAAVADADLVIDNGLGLAPWFPALASRAGGPVLSLGDALDDVAVDTDDGQPDPHTWMVPAIVAERYLPVITEALAEVDPDGSDGYAERAAAYADELIALDVELEDVLATIPPDRRLLVTSHDAYTYFGERYDLEVATPIGVTTEEEPSASRVAALVDAVRASGVPTIFVETTVNPGVVRRIASDAGVAIGDPLYGDSVGEPGSGAETYADMLRANARALADGLGGGS